MGSETTATLVIFIATVAAAGVASAAVVGVIGDMSIELRQQGKNVVSAMGTDLAIVNDPKNVPYDDPDLTIYVKNTGSETLVSEEVTVLLDGTHANFTFALLDGADRWSDGVVAELTVDAPGLGNNEDHVVRVIHTPSVHDTMNFRT